jgi:hypothetical protein
LLLLDLIFLSRSSVASPFDTPVEEYQLPIR